MAIVQVKSGVRVDRIRAGLAWIIYCLEEFGRRYTVQAELPEILVITSIADGKHMEGSKHYKGEALDIRSKDFPTRESKREFRNNFERYLNKHPFLDYIGNGLNISKDKFRVLLEGEATDNEHFHVQVAKNKEFP